MTALAAVADPASFKQDAEWLSTLTTRNDEKEKAILSQADA